MSGISCRGAVCGLLSALVVTPASAVTQTQHLDGERLGIFWVLPFVGMLLSIAILPLATPCLWHRHQGKIAALWALAFLVPATMCFGLQLAAFELLHTAALEYLPFLILHIRGNLHGSPLLNTGVLAIGTLLASVMGTTGAAMLLIRPLIRANDNRRHNMHVVIFFIFLVANIGGALTPLGDPPLFLGFLQGVTFFWTTIHLIAPTAVAAIILLAAFFCIDLYFYRREGCIRPDPTPDSGVTIQGAGNLMLLVAILVVVVASGSIKLGTVPLFSVALELQNILRDVLLVAIAILSFKLTSNGTREANEFSFGPVIEVAKLFAGIFVTIVPAIAILRAGRAGSLAVVIDLITSPSGQPIDSMYFWLTGGLSSFLDNAPTYLVFFHAAGADAQRLMGPLGSTLTAISAGAVYMGAITYIGNAPNFMIKSIAQSRGVNMPGFFGYILWSGCVLIPVFALLTWLFFV